MDGHRPGETHVRELVCADVSNILLDEARVHLATHPNVRFLCTRGFTLDALDAGAFDLVYALGVFSFFDPNQALALLDEVCRVLAPAGMSAVNFFSIDQPPWAAHAVSEARRLARRRIFHAGVARPYTAEQIVTWHAAVGLRVVDQQRGNEVPGGPRVPCLFIAARDAGPGAKAQEQ